MVCLFFVSFVIMSYFLGFGSGLARSKFKVIVCHGTQEDLGIPAH